MGLFTTKLRVWNPADPARAADLLESLGVAADPVQKKLVPPVLLALAVRARVRRGRRSRIVEAIDGAIAEGCLREPFSNEDFRSECPGFGRGTYKAFLWKHSRGNPGGETVFFERVGKNQFRKVR